MKLPKHLQVTYSNILHVKKADATTISNMTGRARAVESHYLNTLVTLGLVHRTRKGRIVYFDILRA